MFAPLLTCVKDIFDCAEEKIRIRCLEFSATPGSTRRQKDVVQRHFKVVTS